MKNPWTVCSGVLTIFVVDLTLLKFKEYFAISWKNKKALKWIPFQSINPKSHVFFSKYNYNFHSFFFHPDFTVGFGVSPNHALRLVGFTTGRELHPALKTFLFYFLTWISLYANFCGCQLRFSLYLDSGVRYTCIFFKMLLLFLKLSCLVL